MDESLKVFSEECDDLLERMEHVLLEMEADPDNPALVDELFRIVHTIKGSSGLFGFSHLVGFSHELENLAVQVREGVLSVTQPLCDIMLESRDLLLSLVDSALGRELQETLEAMDAREASLLRKIKDFDVNAGATASVPAAPAAAAESKPAQTAAPAGPSTFRIDIEMQKDVLTFGLDPLPSILYLQDLGTVSGCTIDTSALPEFSKADFSQCYVVFHLVFETEKTQEEVEEALGFLKESGKITITSAGGSAPSQASEPAPVAAVVAAPPQPVATAPQASASPAVPADTAQLKVPQSGGKEGKAAQGSGKNQGGESVRVDADKLENLINLVGELVIANANTNLLAKNGEVELLTDATDAMLSLVEDIRDTTLSLRMVQIGSVFNRFKRVVREVSQELGKNIDLQITGGDTELDKTIVDKISDPLMHMIRNAIDHGIESPEDRVKAGKSEKGLVKLNAYHDSGVIVIEIIDDGKGLSKDKILDRAVERGLISDKSQVPERNVYDLIFYPGFSTAEKVTNLSGRGVGMDVVKRNIDALNGQIDVESEAGSYAKISIRLPLTLAIIDGFLFEVGGFNYVVPLDMVDECVEFNEDNNANYVDTQFINLRGEIMPFMRLKDFFEVNGMMRPEAGALGADVLAQQAHDHEQDDAPDSHEHSRSDARESVIVIRSNAGKSGIVVDKLLGEYQTVIKPVGRVFKNLQWLSGATILGNGDVAIILDVLMLIKHVSSQTGSNVQWAFNEAV